ncbi:MAG: hypothetical protein OQL19_06035 [Gammaproteobacteria bacterium]|nr:hypothetical protein [Gammaproteobacteria bacterium]
MINKIFSLNKIDKFTQLIDIKHVFIILLLIIPFLSGCGSAFVASKQDDILTQIDVWSSENEYGKALSTIDYVKKNHPQYQELQIRKKTLLTQATEYEKQIDTQIKTYIKTKKWKQALDLIDQAKEKYPLGESKNRLLAKTEKNLLAQQKKSLTSIDQSIMIERSLWMIKTLPIYHEKLNTDPRNEVLYKQVEKLNQESSELSKKLTLLAEQAIARKHFKTARIRIQQAITLEPSKQRQLILSKLNSQSKKSYLSKQKKKKISQDKSHQTQQNSLLQEIEKSYNRGDFLKTRQLISELDDNGQNDIQLIQIKQELDRSISYTIKQLMSKANKNYTDGQFHQAIELWQQVLMYEPQNVIAKKNILRAEKVIEKLSSLREKQGN